VAQQRGAAQPGNLIGNMVYKTPKIKVPTTITTYNPAAANAQVRNFTTGTDCVGTTVFNSTQNSFAVTCTTNFVTTAGDLLGVHWSSDARLAQ
jgi:hypothetical protein